MQRFSKHCVGIIKDLYLQALGGQLAAIPGTGYDMVGRDVTGTTFVFVFAGFALIGLALWTKLPRGEVRARIAPHAAILAALVSAYFVRWFLFPYLWDRMFALVYLVVPLLLVSMASAVVEGMRGDTGGAPGEARA